MWFFFIPGKSNRHFVTAGTREENGTPLEELLTELMQEWGVEVAVATKPKAGRIVPFIVELAANSCVKSAWNEYYSRSCWLAEMVIMEKQAVG